MSTNRHDSYDLGMINIMLDEASSGRSFTAAVFFDGYLQPTPLLWHMQRTGANHTLRRIRNHFNNLSHRRKVERKRLGGGRFI